MDPNDLREIVEREIEKRIEPEAWQRCEVVNKAEQESSRSVLDSWRLCMMAPKQKPPPRSWQTKAGAVEL